MYFIIVCLCLVGCVVGAPANISEPLEKQQPTVIPIISQLDELEPNGTYKYSYETGNGIKREETSYDKVLPIAKSRSADSNEGGESDESNEIHVQRGSYSYVAPDGTVITVRYIADENGFQPIGDHIPRLAPVLGSSESDKDNQSADNSEAGSSVIPLKVASDATQVKVLHSESQPSIESRSGKTSIEASSAEGNSTSSTVAPEKKSTTAASSESSTTDVTTEEASTTESSTSTASEEISSTTDSLSTTTEVSSSITTELPSSTVTTDGSTTEGSGQETTVAQDETKTSEASPVQISTETSSTSISSTSPNFSSPAI